MGYVYLIISPSNRKYVGSCKDINNRIKHYKTLNCKHQIKLYRSIKKHGWDKHSISVIWEGEDKLMLRKENELGLIHSVLNKTSGLNLKLPKVDAEIICYSDETRVKMSKSQKARKRKRFTKEDKANMSKVKKGFIFSELAKTNRMKACMVKVVCEKTGREFDSVKQAAEFYKINRQYLSDMLNGKSKNKTTLKKA